MSALPTARMGANISDTVSYKQSLNPYPDGLPDSVSVAWNNRMKEFFGLFPETFEYHYPCDGVGGDGR